VTVPVEPPPTPWAFPSVDAADESGLVGVGGDLEPGTVLAAYRSGLFPMPLGGRGPLGWWSPDPRAVVPLDGLRVTRSLRRSIRRYEVRVDTAFEQVVEACGDPGRPHGWITPEIRAAYTRLHRLGWAHSIEAWSRDDGTLAGGLYGVAIGGLFAGESMFYRVADASKAALAAIAPYLERRGYTLFDVQWTNAHTRRLGAIDIPRSDYQERLAEAIKLPVTFRSHESPAH
jgi:leucyl/phenylalanyl-tRNA--protein transferase